MEIRVDKLLLLLSHCMVVQIFNISDIFSANHDKVSLSLVLVMSSGQKIKIKLIRKVVRKDSMVHQTNFKKLQFSRKLAQLFPHLAWILMVHITLSDSK